MRRLRAWLAVRASAVYLTVLVVAGFGICLFWISHEVHVQQAAQQRAGQTVERKLCASFGKLARLQPPAGDPGANPSRAYLQQEHAALIELAADIGCRR